MGPAQPRLSAAARGRRLDAATGVVAVILVVAAFAVPGSAPTADDTADAIAAFLTDKRDRILLSSFLAGLAGLFFLWWLASLRSWLRAVDGGEARLSSAAFLAGGVAVGLSLTATAVEAGLAFKVGGQAEQPVVRALFDIRSALFSMSAFAYAATIAAAASSGARSGALPAITFWAGGVIAGLNAAAGAALFAQDGFFAAGGPMSVIALVTALGWFLAVALLMIRRPEPV